MNSTFTYFGRPFDLFDDEYNTTRLNERAVEIPIARHFLAGCDGEGLEVGNVLSHYGPVDHRIVDRHEIAAGVDNADIFEISGTYDWAVSISTLEHVRHDEPVRNPHGAHAALIYLTGLVAPGGRLLVTVPLGCNEHLDDKIFADHLGVSRSSTLIRDGDSWRQTPTLTWRPYAMTTIWAEAVWVGEWGPA